MFEIIKNDTYILDIYNEIEKNQETNVVYTHHGLVHVNNVIKMIENILVQLDYDNEFIENAKIAALLHDVGMIYGKENHDVKGYEIAKEYFELKKFNLKYEKEILESIRLHRDTFNSDNIMAITLMLADKIDIKKNRLISKGYEIIGLRQCEYIEDIDIIINKTSLIVKFIIEDKCNKKELEEWYFMKKVFNAVEGFARVSKLDYKILYNNVEWYLTR